MGDGNFFADVKFFIAECEGSEEIRDLLVREGARHINYLSENVTHVIADRVCPDAEEAVELYDKPVVKSNWVRLSLRTRKLWPVEAFSPFNTTFVDVVAFFSKDLTPKDIRNLQAVITANGGRLTGELTAATHFVAASAKPSEFESGPASGGKFKIVAPDWIYDSIAAKRGCDETQYDPKLLLSPPKPPTPEQPTPPPVFQPQPQMVEQPQQTQQQRMIDLNGPKDPQQSDSNIKGQHNRTVSTPTNEKQARKIDTPNQIRTQSPLQLGPQPQQVNAMQQMTRGPPPLTPNVIRGASPRFRPHLPPHTPRSQPQGNRFMSTEEHIRRPVDYNPGFRKSSPQYAYNSEMHQAQHQQIQQPHQMQQRQPYQQIELAQTHHHSSPMNQPMRPAQPQMYQQTRPSYQNSGHMHPRTQNPQTSPMLPQQMHQQPVQNLQDPNGQMSQARYQMSAPHQQMQVVNPGYQQSPVQRQTVYYNQNTNTQPMLIQQSEHMIRGSMAPNNQVMVNDPHHRFSSQVQAQQAPVYQQHLQRAPIQVQKAQPFQHPHPSAGLPNQIQLQPNMQNSPVMRPQRNPISNQTDPKNSSIRRASTSQSPEKASRTQRNSNAQLLAHPSMFDKQESSYAHMKAKVPTLPDTIQYCAYSADQNIPDDRPLLGCRFQLIEYDDMEPARRNALYASVIEAGGIFEENLENLTHLICQTQTSSIFLDALKRGVRCVTSLWIDDILRLKRQKYPWSALHLPTSFGKDDKPLSKWVISHTNFSMLDKNYVKTIIEMTGAKPTDEFSKKNNLLICGKSGGKKFKRALEWQTPMANGLLISDYLIGGGDFEQLWRLPKYINYDADNQLILESSDSSEIRALLAPWKKPIIITSELALNGIPGSSHPKDKAPEVTDVNDRGSAQSQAEVEDKLDTTPSHDMTTDAKPNETATVNDSTEAKIEDSKIIESATNETSEMTKSVDIATQSTLSHSLQTIDEKRGSMVEHGSNCDTTINRDLKVRTSKAPVRLLFTRLKPEMQARLEAYAAELGIISAFSPLDCTHLIVDRISRSPKFICAFNNAEFILSYKWILDSHKYGRLLDEVQYIIQDVEGERKFSFNLAHSMIKRRKRKSPLFQDYIFFVTRTPLKKVADLLQMMRSAGAGVEIKKLPTSDQISQLRGRGQRFVIVADEQDLYLCDDIEAYGVDIVSVEFVISGILRQDVDFDSHRLNRAFKSANERGFNTVLPSPQKRIRQM